MQTHFLNGISIKYVKSLELLMGLENFSKKRSILKIPNTIKKFYKNKIYAV